MMLVRRIKKLSNLSILRSSAAAAAADAADAETPSPKNPFMAEYLISSCGFSPPEAIKASNYLTRIRSPSQPDSILRLLRQIGSTDAQIRSIISKFPRVLYASAEKNLKPNIKILQELGFSESELTQLVSDNAIALKVRDLRPKIQFWKTLFGANEDLLKVLRRGNLLSCSVSKKIEPNMSLLRGCGISDRMIARMIMHSPRTLVRSPESIKDIISRVDHLGVSRSSGMFAYLLRHVSQVSKASFNAKIKLLKILGWSAEEVLSAFVKAPCLLAISEKNIRSKMDFLVKEAGCECSYIALNPLFLVYSLAGRLIPRHRVVQILKSKELIKSGLGLYSVMPLTEKRFMERYVIPYMKKIPELPEAYASACRGYKCWSKRIRSNQFLGEENEEQSCILL